jgi:hypothetical protein
MNMFHKILCKAFLAFICIFPLLAEGDNSQASNQKDSVTNRSYPINNQNQGQKNTYYQEQRDYNQGQYGYRQEAPYRDYSQGQYNDFNQNGQFHGEYTPNYEGFDNSYSSSDSNCCQPCDPCCKPKSAWDKIALPLLVGAAAVAGGFIGGEVADGKRGHRGATGAAGTAGAAGNAGTQGGTGDVGPAGTSFVADTGETLTFRLSGLFPAVAAGSVVALPFVTAPDGTTFEGTAVVTPTVGGTVAFDPIVIDNPVFGFYNFGLKITNVGAILAGVTLNQTSVIASRNGSTTTELTPVAGTTIAAGESQISSTFTYDPANVP